MLTRAKIALKNIAIRDNQTNEHQGNCHKNPRNYTLMRGKNITNIKQRDNKENIKSFPQKTLRNVCIFKTLVLNFC